MTVYSIINPSDSYTLAADDLKIAALAVFLLGKGKYGLETRDGEQAVPLFLFGGADEWVQEQFGITLEELMSGAVSDGDLATCLESVVIGDFADRELFLKTVDLLPESAREAWIEGWNDSKRSSLNDIGGRAKDCARFLRDREEGKK